jgi:hypothetical protein
MVLTQRINTYYPKALIPCPPCIIGISPILQGQPEINVLTQSLNSHYHKALNPCPPCTISISPILQGQPEINVLTQSINYYYHKAFRHLSTMYYWYFTNFTWSP